MTTTTSTAPHVFAPDHQGEPGYRPRCRVCGLERHPGPVPVPRRPEALTDRVTAHAAEEPTDAR